MLVTPTLLLLPLPLSENWWSPRTPASAPSANCGWTQNRSAGPTS